MSNKLPKGWIETELKNCILYAKSGGTPSTKNKDYYDGFIPFVKIDDISNGSKYLYKTKIKINANGIRNSAAWIIPKDSLIYSMYASYGIPIINKKRVATSQAMINMVFTKDFYIDYMYYYLLDFKSKLSSYTKGTTQANLNANIVSLLPIKLAPLNEQKRIVTKIEKLFSNLDKSDQHLAHLKKQLKRYRQSVLKSAFEGELTREWREKQVDLESADELLEKIKAERVEYVEQEVREKFKDKTEKWIKDKVKKEVDKFYNGLKNIENIDKPFEIPKAWEWKLIQESTLKIHYGYTASSSYDIVGPKLLRITDIQNNKVNWNTVPSCIINDNEAKKYTLENNDIVFARTGATVGKSFLIKNIPVSSVFASYLIRLIPSQNMDAEYIYKFFQSPVYWNQIRENESGIGQPNVNAEKLSNLIFPIPSLREQKELVKEIEKHFLIIDKLEAVVQKSITESKRLRQSILKQAFEGKLVEQDPNDESAEELLKKIAKAKEEYKKQMSKRKKK
ncbi:restriction endonuclease subunit S [Sulfurimonas sp. SWIR-19]|uniref:restriction endonuclease subunit S n=1 Tax=Sulfurimonas sp. SWIR-19 TaxID=2878390 RepID=UPI001CF1D2FC|nr:restriction endonuclease subunit S [Sulfurimonas sp. SWIR-19]UCN00138.1 restriction endonuclease subunit S [Sulfurimonas sp. SWIR-19]